MVLDARNGGPQPFTEGSAFLTGNNHSLGSQMPRLHVLSEG